MLVGRHKERAALDEALAAADEATPQLRLILGPAGIGKSSLAMALVERARERGFVAGVGRAPQDGGAPPFWPWTEVLEALGEDLRIGDAARPIGEVLLRPLSGPHGDGERFLQFDGLRRGLAALSARASLLLVLDDLHAADEPSIRLLSFIARRLDRGRVLIVCCARDAPAEAATAAAASTLAELATAGQAIELAGLEADEVALLARRSLGRALDEPVLAELAERSGGNPFFLIELLHAAKSSDAALPPGGAGATAVPVAVRELLRRQLGRLDPRSRRIITTAAVLGGEAPIGLLARVAAATEVEVLAAIGHGQAAHLLEATATRGGATLRFAHALVCDAIATALPPTERLAVHAQAVDALADSPGGDSDRILSSQAHHASIAAPLGAVARRRAVTLLRLAGERAMQRLAFEEAARCLSQALERHEEGGGDAGLAVDLRVGLAEAQRAAGRSGLATAALGGALTLIDPALDSARFARIALAAAGLREFMTTDRGPLRLLERAVVAPGLDDETVVRLKARLARDLVMETGTLARRDTLSREAVALARALDRPAVLGLALDARLHAVYGPASLEERDQVSAEIRQIARATLDLPLEIAGIGWKLSALIERGELAEAGALAVEHGRLADQSRLPSPRVNSRARRATLAFVAGRYPEGDRWVEEMREVGRAGEDPGIELMRAAVLLVPSVQRQRRELLEELVGVLDEHQARMHTPALITALSTLARLALARRGEALASWERLAARDFADLPDDFVRTGLLCLLAWIASELDDGPRAAHLLPLVAPYRQRNGTCGTNVGLGAVSLYEGLAARTAGDAARAARCLSDAERANAAMGAEPFRAIAARQGAGATAARPPDRRPLPGRTRTALLRRDGDGWAASLDGVTVRLRAQRGFELIARLVAAGGSEVHVLDLGEGASAGEEGLRRAVGAEAGAPLIDGRARAEIKQRLEDLDDQLAEAEAMNDAGRAERARGEREALVEYLASASGLGGKVRRGTDATERARVAATVAIKRSLTALSRHLPELAAHLESAIHTGALCRYEPDPSAAIRVTT